MGALARGNLIIGQSGGPTAVINSSLVGAVHEALRQPAIRHVVGTLHGVEGILKGDLVDLGQESSETLDRLRRTPSAGLGSGRHKLRDGDADRVLDVLADLDVRYFLYIGGNDSADTTHQLTLAAERRGHPLRAIAIPKTVDNDLPVTDHCPGYGSAARFVAMAARDAGRDTEAMRLTDPIKLIEVPGRNAGWLAAASALGRESEADAPQIILPPERPLALERFLEVVQRAFDRLGFVVAVVAETIRDEHGEPLGARLAEASGADAFGHRRLSGAAGFLCREITARLGLRARWEKPGNLSRTSMACVSEVDLAEASLVGERAVRAALDGETDRMVTLVREPGDLYRSTTGLAPLDLIANREHLLPEEYLSPDGTSVSPAFLEYARPLIGGPLPPYARLSKVRFDHSAR